MLFKMAALEEIAAGRITLAFRRWQRPTVREGGELKTAVGVLEIEEIDIIDPADISRAAAKQAGFSSVEEVLASLGTRGGNLYRIRFRLAGADPRIALRAQPLSAAEWTALQKRLLRLPWAKGVLQVIADHPARRAGDLADILGVEKDGLKLNVRKLKSLGLTESLGTGYRISPRGAAVLAKLT